MNVEKINEMKETIAQKIRQSIQINNLDLSDVFSDHKLGAKAFKLEFVLDLEQVRNEDVIKDEELRDSLRELPDNKLVVTSDCLCARIQQVIPCALVDEFNC